MTKKVKILFSGFDINGCKGLDTTLGPCLKVCYKLVEDCVTIKSIHKSLHHA